MRALLALALLAPAAARAQQAGWENVGKQEPQGFSWTQPLFGGFWMAWTPATLAFFAFVFGCIALMGLLEWRAPGRRPAPRHPRARHHPRRPALHRAARRRPTSSSPGSALFSTPLWGALALAVALVRLRVLEGLTLSAQAVDAGGGVSAAAGSGPARRPPRGSRARPSAPASARRPPLSAAASAPRRPASGGCGGIATSSKLMIPAASGAPPPSGRSVGRVEAPGRRLALDAQDHPVQRPLQRRRAQRHRARVGQGLAGAANSRPSRRPRARGSRGPAPSSPPESRAPPRPSNRYAPAAEHAPPDRRCRRAWEGPIAGASGATGPRPRERLHRMKQQRAHLGRATLRGDRRRLRLPGRLGGPLPLCDRARPRHAAARRGAAGPGHEGGRLRQPGLDRAAHRGRGRARRASISRAIPTR